jgi:DNA-binding transcriptional LysR family regulator
MEWDDLKHVAALWETGSVRRAGERLGLHGATVARHIERLESRLGVRLFARTRRGMEITAAGRRVVEAYREAADRLAALERDLQAENSALAGPATLFVSEALAAGWLLSRLREFARRYPDVQLTVRLADRSSELAPGAAEAALMLTQDPPGHLVGRKLGSVAVCGYRSASSRPERQPLDIGRGAGLIGPLLPDFAAAWQAAGHGPTVEAPVHCPVLLAQLEAARSGLGIAVLPCALGDTIRGLARVEPGVPVPAAEAWLLSHPDSRGIARLQALLGYVQEIWTLDRARLEGRAHGTETAADA